MSSVLDSLGCVFQEIGIFLRYEFVVCIEF